MCTVTWCKNLQGLDVYFNRDEQRTRPPALPPITHPNGVTMPIDPRGGGTWIFVNPHGLIGALLNHYPAPPPGSTLRSRGLLLKALSTASTPHEFARKLRSELHEYPTAPCKILCLHPDHTPSLSIWDGMNRKEETISVPMVTTSSFQPDSIPTRRREIYHHLVNDPTHPTPAELLHFHRHFDRKNPATSISMQRDDACTVSLVHIHNQRMTYETNWNKSPDLSSGR